MNHSEEPESQDQAHPFFGASRQAVSPYIPDKLPGELYHYPSAAGLIGILSSHSLWFTDAAFLNDSSETFWGVNLIADVANTFARTLAPEDQILVDRVIERLRLIAFPNRGAIFCLCEEQNLLNQWRDYGRDVVPYSIGFDPKALHLAPDYNFQPLLIKVIYDPADQQNIAETLIGDIYQRAGKLDAAVREDESAVVDLINRAAHELWLATIFMKNPAFSAEREWRLIVEAATIKSGGTDVSFRTSSVGVTPYFIWHRKDGGLLPISSVMAGPSPWPDATMAGLGVALTENGYVGIPVNASTIPIR